MCQQIKCTIGIVLLRRSKWSPKRTRLPSRSGAELGRWALQLPRGELFGCCLKRTWPGTRLSLEPEEQQKRHLGGKEGKARSAGEAFQDRSCGQRIPSALLPRAAPAGAQSHCSGSEAIAPSSLFPNSVHHMEEENTTHASPRGLLPVGRGARQRLPRNFPWDAPACACGISRGWG